MNPAMNQAYNWLQTQSNEMADELEKLCNINSSSDNLDGLLRAADWLTNYFQPLGVPCERIDLPSYPLIDDLGNETINETGPALRWNLGGAGNRGSATKNVLLTIHYDTVYGLQDPFQKCTRLEGGRMRGPGVIDAKGGIVVMRYAAMAASRYLDLDSLRLSVILTPDEEIGSPSTITLWNKIAHEFNCALLFEPSMADGSLVSSRKGTGTFTIVVHGKAAHAGRNFNAGRNAVVHASRMVADLHELNGQRPNITVNVGRIRGGHAVNVVPDLAVTRVNVRVSSMDDQQWIESQVQRLVDLYNVPEQGYTVTVQGSIHAPPKIQDEGTTDLMKRVERSAGKLGESIRWKQSGGASDGNKLQGLRLPNIDTLGPDGDGLHSDQEWVLLESLPRKAAMVFGILEELASE